MNQYSISQVSEKLNIQKDTLRYYDKIKLISPGRGENRYRYYTEADMMDLIYIQVMKFAGFSLGDMKKVLKNKNSKDHTSDCAAETMQLLKQKKSQTLVQIEVLQKLAELISISIELLKGKTLNNPDEINNLVLNIHQNMKYSEGEKK